MNYSSFSGPVAFARIAGTVQLPSTFVTNIYKRVMYITGSIDLNSMRISGIDVPYEDVVAAFNTDHDIIARLGINENDELFIPLTQFIDDNFLFIADVSMHGAINTLYITLQPDGQCSVMISQSGGSSNVFTFDMLFSAEKSEWQLAEGITYERLVYEVESGKVLIGNLVDTDNASVAALSTSVVQFVRFGTNDNSDCMIFHGIGLCGTDKPYTNIVAFMITSGGVIEELDEVRLVEYAELPVVPGNVSAFSNDAGYQNAGQVRAAAQAAASVVEAKIPAVPTDVSAFNNDSGYQTAQQVSATAQSFASAVEAKIPTVPAKVSAFENDVQYQTKGQVEGAVKAASDLVAAELAKKANTEHDHDGRYYSEAETDALLAKKQDAIPQYVATVNGESGNVEVTTESIGAEPVGTSEQKVSEHNTSQDAHNDIRLLLQQLTDKINAVLDSDEETLDQMSEIVAYIQANKSLIDAITTSKISYADIIDNLTTNVTNKPLSAAQGVVIKRLIDSIVVPTKVSDLANDSKYATETQVEQAKSEVEAKIPTVPTAVSSFTNDAGYQTAAQVQAAAQAAASVVEAKIPTVPTAVSSFTNDAGYQTAAQVQAAAQAAASVVEAKIPAVPSKVSSFTNDAGYQTAEQVHAAVSAVDKIFAFEFAISISASGLTLSLPEGVTYADIDNAVNSKLHVIGCATLPSAAGSMAGKYLFPFIQKSANGSLVFSAMCSETLVYCTVQPDGSVGFTYTLVEQQGAKTQQINNQSNSTQYPSAKAVYDFVIEQTGDLTFKVANTVPTVDDRSVITFVVEE